MAPPTLVKSAKQILLQMTLLLSLVTVVNAGQVDDDGQPPKMIFKTRPPSTQQVCASALETLGSLALRSPLRPVQLLSLWMLVREGLIPTFKHKLATMTVPTWEPVQPLHFHPRNELSRATFTNPGRKLDKLDLTKPVTLITMTGRRVKAFLQRQPDGSLSTYIILDSKVYKTPIHWNQVKAVIAQYANKKPAQQPEHVDNYRLAAQELPLTFQNFYTSTFLHAFKISGYATLSTAFSPDGTKFVTSTNSDGAEVAIWDVRTGRKLRRLATGDNDISYVTWSHDGTKLFTSVGSSGRHGKADMPATIWNASTGKAISALAIVGSKAFFSNDDLTLVNEQGTWDVNSGKKLTEHVLEFEKKRLYLRDVRQSEDGTLRLLMPIFFSEPHLRDYQRYAVAVVDTASGNVLRTMGQGYELGVTAFFIPGTHIVAFQPPYQSDKMFFYDADTGEHRGTVTAEWGHNVLPSPNGEMLISESRDYPRPGANIFSATTGNLLFTLRTPEGLTADSMGHPKFSPQGDLIATDFHKPNDNDARHIGIYRVINAVVLVLVD